MITYALFETPFGTMCVARSHLGICRILFPEAIPFETNLVTYYPNQSISKNPDGVKNVIRQFDEYFAGQRKKFDLDLDLQTPPFYQKVLQEVLKIPYGEKLTYKQIAENCGNPGAMRAVGGANAKNPIPIIIPCHRVIAHDGSLGGYGGRLDRKMYLLEMERKYCN